MKKIFLSTIPSKIYLTTIFSLFSFCIFGQNINLDSIKVNVQNENSDFYYEKLIYKFKFDPTTLSDEEVKNLYYGKKFSKYKPSFFDTDYLDFTKSLSQGNLKKAIISGEKYLEKDPTNPEVLAYMEMAYKKKDKESKNILLYSLQAKTIVDCILKNGDGKTEATAFKVNSIGEEYFIASILGKNIRTFKRSTMLQKTGTIDVFSKGKETIYFMVYEDLDSFK
ncbi:DUF4919 domain-containing protein [Chryseobacterium sp. c4a]|uniref:DUF4919 domain-containing protein n=1 Tax=Chryseobacterium sp. c4a TaxID=1573582 RepID=UPI0013589DDA|nr:DUF4919 domain-containing protein [Chryseobacterium sp. c4a]